MILTKNGYTHTHTVIKYSQTESDDGICPFKLHCHSFHSKSLSQNIADCVSIFFLSLCQQPCRRLLSIKYSFCVLKIEKNDITDFFPIAEYN